MRVGNMLPESFEALAAMDPLLEHGTQRPMEEGRGVRERAFADPECLLELLHTSESGSLQMATLARQWQRRQENAVQLLRQQLDTLDMQRMQAERQQRLLLEGHWSPQRDGNGFPTKQEERGASSSPMEEDETSSSGPSSSLSSLAGSVSCSVVDETENSVQYWKERAKTLELLLAESIQREEALLNRIQESGLQPASSVPFEELQEKLQRLDNFLHFTLHKAPVVIAHQDKELRYRFVYNAFPSMIEEEVMGKTDLDIYTGIGIQECVDFKREVLQRGRPSKREIFLDTDLFGPRTFLIAAEPVFTKSGETLGLNFVAMDVTDEALKREALIVLREDIAVQKAMETELHKTIDITEETMRAKQMLATMSHEIRSPLSGVVSIAELLARTKLDAEQRQLVEVMMSSGDLVLQLINDILDLSKVESGEMKLEAKKFRPREVVKHVLQMALAFVQNRHLSLEGTVAEDVPFEVVGDVLRIRQVFTNLVSNAVKFTHKGEVAIKVMVMPPPTPSTESVQPYVNKPCPSTTVMASDHLSGSLPFTQRSTIEQESNSVAQENCQNDLRDVTQVPGISRSSSSASSVSALSSASSRTLSSSSSLSVKSVYQEKGKDEAGPPSEAAIGGLWESLPKPSDQIWLHCEVCDTGIGIPEAALPSLFEKYTQVSTTHARKYGGTGLGLAICKQLVSLMGGNLEVKSQENVGSVFSFTLPLKVVNEKIGHGPSAEQSWGMMSNLQGKLENSSKKRGYFQFTPDGITSEAGSRGGSLAPNGSDGKVKGLKNSHGKLKHRDSFSKNPGITLRLENIVVGQGKSIGEKGVSKVLQAEGNMTELGRSDMTGSSSSVESLELVQDTGVAIGSKTKSPALPSFDSNLSRKCTCSLKITTPLQLPVEKVIRKCPHIDPRITRLPRILLAEDNKVNFMVVESMLKRLGHSLEVVNNGGEAVKALQRGDYDLVLMDVSMPVMDGLEATRIIRKFEQTGQWAYGQDQAALERNIPSVTSSDMVLPRGNPETAPMYRHPKQRTPIIAMTANALADNVVECYHHGMDSFIAKPVTFQKLEQVLKQFVPWAECHRVEAC